MATGLHAPNTRAGRAMNDLGNSGDSSDVSELGSTATDNASVVDEYSLSIEDKAELGVKDNETVVYGARDSIWPRRFANLRRKYGEARVVKNEATKADPCEHLDLQMIAVPKVRYEEIERDRKKRGDDYMAQFQPRRGEYIRHQELFERTPENLALRRSMNEEMFEEMGIGANGPTAGMSLPEGLAYLQRQGMDPDELADRARTGGAHRGDNQAAWKAAMRGQSTQGKSFAVKAGFAPEVPAKSALGQVREKNARAATGSTAKTAR